MMSSFYVTLPTNTFAAAIRQNHFIPDRCNEGKFDSTGWKALAYTQSGIGTSEGTATKDDCYNYYSYDYHICWKEKGISINKKLISDPLRSKTSMILFLLLML